MNDLLQKYNDYMRLNGCKAEYELLDGTKLEVLYQEENFAHLLGLHKLKDIQLIQFWLDKSNKTVKLQTVIKRIKNETFTDEMVKNSYFYLNIPAYFEPSVRTLRATLPALRARIPVSGNRHSGLWKS